MSGNMGAASSGGSDLVTLRIPTAKRRMGLNGAFQGHLSEGAVMLAGNMIARVRKAGIEISLVDGRGKVTDIA